MLRIALFVLSVLAGASSCEAQTTIGPTWATASAVHYNIGPPRQYQGPIYASTCQWNGSNCGPGVNQSGSWHQANLTQSPWNVGITAKAALVSGILIITSGSTVETDEIELVFRAPGDTRVNCDASNLIGQTVFQRNSGDAGGGQRSNISTIVPVVNGIVEWCWTRPTPGTYPINGSYGINLSVQMWFE